MEAGGRLNWLRKLVAFVAVFAVVCAVIAPSCNGLLWAIVLPVLLLVAVLVVASTDFPPHATQRSLFQFSSVLAPRAPPYR